MPLLRFDLIEGRTDEDADGQGQGQEKINELIETVYKYGRK